MLETSKDLLNLIIAFCILWFTIFLCWMLYYFASILKKVNEVMGKMTGTLDAVTMIFTKAKEKLDSFGSSLAVVLGLSQKIFDKMVDKKKQNTNRRNKKK